MLEWGRMLRHVCLPLHILALFLISFGAARGEAACRDLHVALRAENDGAADDSVSDRDLDHVGRHPIRAPHDQPEPDPSRRGGG